MSDTTGRPPFPLPPGRHVELPGRGTTFVHQVAGPPGAPALVLLHGLGATADLNWFATYRPLGEHYRVVALDHRGHGHGIRVRGRFRLADCADDVAALAEQLGLERVVAVGYSMGGPIAQLLWHRHRDLVSALVLCATARNFTNLARAQLMLPMMAGLSAAARFTPSAMRQLAISRALPLDIDAHPVRQWAISELRRNDPATVLAAATALMRFSSHAWIGDVDVPTAVVVTARDRLVPVHRQEKLASAIPGATVHVVDADHDAAGNIGNKFVPVLLDACASVTSRAAVPR